MLLVHQLVFVNIFGDHENTLNHVILFSFPYISFRSYETKACDCAGTIDERAGALELAMVNSVSFPSKACPTGLSSAGYLDQCRPLPYFTEGNVGACLPYLSDNQTYYLGDTQIAGTTVDYFAEVIETAMEPICAANVLSMICNSWYRQCQEVCRIRMLVFIVVS
jgi:hypothetical protein